MKKVCHLCCICEEWTKDVLSDATQSAKSQTVTDNPNEHRQCLMLLQLPCNEVRLVNSHPSNRFSGAETMKHGQRLLLLQLPFVKISQV